MEHNRFAFYSDEDQGAYGAKTDPKRRNRATGALLADVIKEISDIRSKSKHAEVKEALGDDILDRVKAAKEPVEVEG